MDQTILKFLLQKNNCINGPFVFYESTLSSLKYFHKFEFELGS